MTPTDPGCHESGNLSISAAQQILRDTVRALEPVPLPVTAALHRVSAATLRAQTDLPPFDQSAVDGYAVRAADIAAAPCTLPLAGTVAAAPQATMPQLPPGHAVRIFTGGLLPDGTDTVVRQELTEAADGAVRVQRPLEPGVDLRRRGEELSAGTAIIEPGRRLHAGIIGALAAAGVAIVSVRRSPRIRVLVTGDELVPLGGEAGRGQIFDSNGPLVSAWLSAAGYADVSLRSVPDDEGAVRAALESGFREADLVISTGGVSVGDRDLLPPTAAALGARQLFWKVSQKPGKPLYAAIRDNSLFLGLPGNPGAVLINLAVFVRLALDLMEGVADAGPPMAAGCLAADVRGDRFRDSWLRARRSIDGDGRVLLHPLGRQASHMLSNLSDADCLALLPAREGGWAAGTTVRWLPLTSA
ncbi:MAG: molybdopterin molybdotransferase MoeA [Nevskiales bacterium]|nr:molybdopterin molybdotransferase MoeA [Nevskiales bacterium]